MNDKFDLQVQFYKQHLGLEPRLVHQIQLRYLLKLKSLQMWFYRFALIQCDRLILYKISSKNFKFFSMDSTCFKEDLYSDLIRCINSPTLGQSSIEATP